MPLTTYPYKFDPKPAASTDFFFFDWEKWVRAYPGDGIDLTTLAVTAEPTGLTISDVILNGYVMRCTLSGGDANHTYTVTCSLRATPSLRTGSVSATVYITR